MNERRLKVMKINGISMKVIEDNEVYYRMWVKANELPEEVYEQAEEIDDGCDYLSDRDEQYFEIEGYMVDDKANDLKVVYYWDDYETIMELDRAEHDYIYAAFEDFANKYGDRLPDNGELCLGDGEYEEEIPQELKDEWK